MLVVGCKIFVVWHAHKDIRMSLIHNISTTCTPTRSLTGVRCSLCCCSDFSSISHESSVWICTEELDWGTGSVDNTSPLMTPSTTSELSEQRTKCRAARTEHAQYYTAKYKQSYVPSNTVTTTSTLLSVMAQVTRRNDGRILFPPSRRLIVYAHAHISPPRVILDVMEYKSAVNTRSLSGSVWREILSKL